MALNKKVVTVHGISISYWRIEDERISRSKKKIYCTLVGYPTRAERVADYQPLLATGEFEFELDAEMKAAADKRDILYPRLKSHENEEFKLAEDILE